LQVLVMRLHADENGCGETRDLQARGSAHIRLHGTILPVVELDAVLDIAGLLGNKLFSCQLDDHIEPEGGAIWKCRSNL
jgi:hypothetical protein